MAHIVEDRVLEVSTSIGIGPLALSGAVLGYRRIASVCAVNDTFPYYIEAVDANGRPTGDYEYGNATYSGVNTITRTTVRGSSNGGAAVAFTSGTKLVGIGVSAPASPGARADWLAALGLSAPDGSNGVGFIHAGANSVARTLQGKAREIEVSITDKGASTGNSATANGIAIRAAIADAILVRPCVVVVPDGTFEYDSLGNLAYEGLTIRGKTPRGAVLKCVGAGSSNRAMYFDAFEPGWTANDATAPFVRECNLQDITIEGNSSITNAIIEAQGLAMCHWRNVYVREADNTTGIGFSFKGCMLNTWERLNCTTNYDTGMVNIPREGMRLSSGVRNGINIGASTNNTLISTYMEGMPIGTRLLDGSQNTWIGGSDEANTVYGMLIAGVSKMNTFIGRGWESIAATADVNDAGTSQKYLNCYSSNSLILLGRGAMVEGGYFERVQINNTAVKTCISNITINHWASGSGGFVDNGISTQWDDIYDDDTAAYIYPYKARQTITVGASPFTWQNTTGRYVEVIINSGTVTQVLQYRDTDFWTVGGASPGKYLVGPDDELVVSYSGLPTMSYVPLNGFPG